MAMGALLKNYRKRSNRRRKQAAASVSYQPLRLELLEDRLPLATFTVVNTSDSGAGSLRQAILDANSTSNVGEPDLIAFDIPGEGVHTIIPVSPLPAITDPVVIDGYSQPGSVKNSAAIGFNGKLQIELRVDRLPVYGISITSGDSTVQGLMIRGFYRQIQIEGGNNNVVIGNFLGIDGDGTSSVPGVLGTTGLDIRSSNNLVGGTTPADRNVISGNSSSGVNIFVPFGGAGGNLVQGNYIGTDATGSQAIPNGQGIFASGANTLIGGTTPGAGNVIAASAGSGISVPTGPATVQGNLIGTDARGINALGNDFGLSLRSDVLIGGTIPGARNIISGNRVGLSTNTGSENVRIQGNYIGTDITGTTALANQIGLQMGSTGVVVGGTFAGAGNLISGNTQIGIASLSGGPAQIRNLIEGNFIGTDVSGVAPLGNGVGIQLRGRSTTVGGEEPGAGNTIAFNHTGGIIVYPNLNPAITIPRAANNSILSNSIFANGGLGIDLLDDGVTANDPGDSDTGPNYLQNYPVLTAAKATSIALTVDGIFNSTPNSMFRIELFANDAADPSGYGEGQIYLGSLVVTTGTDGNSAPFQFTVPGDFRAHNITATATRIDPQTGQAVETSEFSSAIQIQEIPLISIGDVTVTEGDQGTVDAVFTVTLSTATEQMVTVGFATAAGTAGGMDYEATMGTLTFAPLQTQQSITVRVLGDTIFEATEDFFIDLANATDAIIADGQGRGVILENDGRPTAVISDQTVIEGDSGAVDAVFDVHLSRPSSSTVTIEFATASETATEAIDYGQTNGTLTFAPGETIKSITVRVHGDRQFEPDETFLVELSDPTVALILKSQGRGTIIDNDDANFDLVAAADAGGGPHVRAFYANGEERFGFFAYAANFTGGVRVALGDVTGDGAPDIITAPGPGGGPHIRVFDGVTGQQVPQLVGNFFAYESTFTGGVFVASADFNQDGHADIVTGVNRDGRPQIRVFSGADRSVLLDFIGNFKIDGGLGVAAGDISGDGVPDIIAAPASGRLPAEVHVFDGRTGQLLPGSAGSITPYPGFIGGVYVASGDVNGDGRADIITGAGVGGGPHVKAFSGLDGTELVNFFAYDVGFRGGVRVGLGDVSHDGRTEIVTGAGPGGGPHVKVFALGQQGEIASFFAFSPNFTGGVFVAGSPGAPVEPAPQFAVASHDNSLDNRPRIVADYSNVPAIASIGLSYVEHAMQLPMPAKSGTDQLFSEGVDEDWMLPDVSYLAQSGDGAAADIDSFWHDLGHVAQMA